MTIYPSALDSDLELPRVEEEVSEISGDFINSLRDAVIAIQRTIGINPQGNKTSLTDRINVSIDSNGFIKKTAIETIGLVTLPVVDKHIGATAGIQESKLDLDYGTTYLKNMIDSVKVDVNGVLSGLASVNNSVNKHFLGTGNYHDGYQIKINLGTQYGIGGLTAITVGDSLNEIAAHLFGGNNLIIPHFESGLPNETKHSANHIYVDASGFSLIDRNSSTVQEALDSLDSDSGVLGKSHLIQFHSNGVFKEINSGEFYNPRDKVFGPISGISYTIGTNIIKINGIVSFSSYNIHPGDMLYIQQSVPEILDSGIYQIRAIGPLTNSDTLGDLPVLASDELAIFHTFLETKTTFDTIVATAYRPSLVSSEFCPLACAVRNNETIVDTLSVLNPQAARMSSIGFNGAIIANDDYSLGIKIGIGSGKYRNIVIPSLHLERLALNNANPVDAKSVAERINAYVSDPDLGFHFPITAYCVKDEIAIAHNWVGIDYTIEIVDGYSGNFALGLDAYGADVVGKTVYGNEGNSYIVSGETLGQIEILFEGHASITSDTSTFALYDNDNNLINPLLYGISSGSVMDVSDHPLADSNGSYTLMAVNSTTVSLFSSESISAVTNPTRFNVSFSYSHIPLTILDNAETDLGIVQVYIDSAGKTLLHQRLVYGASLGTAIEIIDVSDGFPVGNITIVSSVSGELINFNIVDDTIAGDTVTIHNEFIGMFKLYHSNGIDYLLVKIIPGPAITGGIESAEISSVIPEDEALLLCGAHFNGIHTITNITDDRLFGNINKNNIREDFIEQVSQNSVVDLRSDGIVQGFDIIDVINLDSLSGMIALPLRGGIAYVDGIRTVVETQKVVIPLTDQLGNPIVNADRIVGINKFGSINVSSDELSSVLNDGYSESILFEKVLPLYCLKIRGGAVTDTIDVRLFINKLDAKIDIIVDERNNNFVGSFKTLEGALLYAENYPSDEKLSIRIIGTINPSTSIVVPNGVSIIGTIPYGGGIQKIVNNDITDVPFITLAGNNRLENIEISSEIASLDDSLVYINGSNVDIEKCSLRFTENISTFDGDVAIEVSNNVLDHVYIIDNIIDGVYSGIKSMYGIENLYIHKNNISNVEGTGGNSYGIIVGSSSRSVNCITIDYNNIEVPSVVSSTDLRGIEIDIGENIDILRISNNRVVHSAQNTMTNGIRIDTVGSGVVDQLFIHDNFIDGIKLDDNNVFGIYVANFNNAFIKNNILNNIGVWDTGRTDLSAIRLATSFVYADVSGNTIKDCDLLKGIETYVQYPTNTGYVKIHNNKIENIGSRPTETAAYKSRCISGGTINSSITDNPICGPGDYGIYWSGANSKISGNTLSQPSDLSDYAFSCYAIYAPASNVDITDNTITGMIYSYGSIGIGNGSAKNNTKIIGNTIAGDLMDKMIELSGAGHIVNANMLINESLFVGQDTIGIELNSVSNSNISNNTFTETISIAIHSSGTAPSNLVVNSNSNEATTNISSIDLTGASDSIFVGNRFDGGSGSNNVPSGNGNRIGFNIGLTDN